MFVHSTGDDGESTSVRCDVMVAVAAVVPYSTAFSLVRAALIAWLAWTLALGLSISERLHASLHATKAQSSQSPMRLMPLRPVPGHLGRRRRFRQHNKCLRNETHCQPAPLAPSFHQQRQHGSLATTHQETWTPADSSYRGLGTGGAHAVPPVWRQLCGRARCHSRAATLRLVPKGYRR